MPHRGTSTGIIAEYSTAYVIVLIIEVVHRRMHIKQLSLPEREGSLREVIVVDLTHTNVVAILALTEDNLGSLQPFPPLFCRAIQVMFQQQHSTQAAFVFKVFRSGAYHPA